MFNLSSQANFYLIIIIITTIINWICSTVIFSWYGFLYYALIALILTPLFILYVYNVDCLTTGDCQIWSWVVAIFSAINLIIATIFIVIITVFTSILQTFINELKFNNAIGKNSLSIQETNNSTSNIINTTTDSTSGTTGETTGTGTGTGTGTTTTTATGTTGTATTT